MLFEYIETVAERVIHYPFDKKIKQFLKVSFIIYTLFHFHPLSYFSNQQSFGRVAE